MGFLDARGTVVSILIPISSFEWWSRYQFRLFPCGTRFSILLYSLFPFSPIQFPFLGVFSTILTKVVHTEAITRQVNGHWHTVSESETRKNCTFFFLHKGQWLLGLGDGVYSSCVF